MNRPGPRTRRLWSGCLIAALLFMQLATAAYACPLLSKQGNSTLSMSATLPCAEMMAQGKVAGDEQPGLCIEHCKAGSQSVERAPAVPAPMPALFALVSVSNLVAERAGPALRSAALRDRAPPLAHSVVHCCYRI